MSTLTPPYTPLTSPPPSTSRISLPPTPTSHTHPSLRHASLRHTAISNESLRPPPVHIARKPLSTVPAYRSYTSAPQLQDLERARKTPDRTFLAPRVWNRWGRENENAFEEEDDLEERRRCRAYTSSTWSPSLPPFAFESHDSCTTTPCSLPYIAPSPLSLVLAADESPALLTAQPVSMRTVSVSSSQPTFPVLRRTSHFTEHFDVSGEAMWASGANLEGARVRDLRGYREGGGRDGEGEKEDEEEQQEGGRETEKKRKWWRWKGVRNRWIKMACFLRSKVEERGTCEVAGPRAL
ncbi:hypothetical protein HBI59_129610 [Parastagonospora nodorum]|nr:hypothetical protein HBI59_129610 [Parastagonospora nodorum]